MFTPDAIFSLVWSKNSPPIFDARLLLLVVTIEHYQRRWSGAFFLFSRSSTSTARKHF